MTMDKMAPRRARFARFQRRKQVNTVVGKERLEVLVGARASGHGPCRCAHSALVDGVLPRVQEAHAAPAQTRQVAPGRYIVRLKPTMAGFTSAASVAATVRCQARREGRPDLQLIFSGFAGNFTDDAARDLARDPNVLDVLPGRHFHCSGAI